MSKETAQTNQVFVAPLGATLADGGVKGQLVAEFRSRRLGPDIFLSQQAP